MGFDAWGSVSDLNAFPELPGTDASVSSEEPAEVKFAGEIQPGRNFLDGQAPVAKKLASLVQTHALEELMDAFLLEELEHAL